MDDSPTQQGLLDRLRINVNQERQVRYWTEKFGVSEEELRR
jgi:hypothetical protein